MIAAGKMTADGLNAFSEERRKPAPEMPDVLPKELERHFRRHARAWANFQAFPPYYRRLMIRRVASGKREETRLSRLQELIELSERNERMKLM